ncbi:MAG: hypothetical protein JST67_10175 [Bacteroidetes bacterium]|nr:hypothetical protein [Bacteroidota bacterium]
MKKIFLSLSVLMCLSAWAQIGKPFPEIKGETFEGKAITLPAAAAGKPTLIGICFSKEAEGDLQTWLNPAYNELVMKKGEKNSMEEAANYDVNCYFFPRMNLINQALEKASKNKIKEKTDKAFWPMLVFFMDGLREYKEFLGAEDRSRPYLFVLDATGKVVHVEKGAYSPEKMDKIQDSFDED